MRRFGSCAAIAVLACTSEPAPPAFDLSAGVEASYRCAEGTRCWSDAAGAAWPSAEGVLRSPPIAAQAGDRLVLRLRSATPVTVMYDGTPVARLAPERPWSPQLFAVTLPATERLTSVELRPGARRGRPAPDPWLGFARVLPAGLGGCFREDRWAARRLVAGAACLGPARAELPRPDAARALDVVALGSDDGPWRLDVSGADPVEVPSGRAWHAARVPLAASGAPGDRLAFEIGASADALRFFSARVRAAPATAERPNVLLLLVDTLRADALGSYGGRNATPRLDALAREGALFERALAPSSWTLPSVASLFTGLDPRGHGTRYDRDVLAPHIPTLAERLGADGRATAAVTASLWVSDRHATHRGFRELHEISPGRGAFGIQAGTSSAVANRHVLPWLERHADERFFLYVHVIDPHEPYTPPDALVPPALKARWPANDPRWRLVRGPSHGRNAHRRSPVEALPPDERAALLEPARALYDAAVRHCDAQLGRILDTLDRLGLRERTLVVVTADHGEEFGEHGRAGHAHSLYAEVTHVPLLLSQPGRVPAGRRVPGAVGLVDVAATVLALASPAGDPALPGIPRVEQLTPGRDGERPRPLRLMHRPQNASRPLLDVPEMDAVVEGPWKLIRNRDARGRPALELFDARSDPRDAHDRAAREPEVRDRLAALLADLPSPESGGRDAAGPLDEQTRERLRALGYAVD